MGTQLGASAVIVRSLPAHGEEIFLTFDDGPEPKCTNRVLDLLAAKKARATFFLISQKALRYPDLVTRILREGHSIGNHSVDHAYRFFFRPESTVRAWIGRAEQDFSRLGVDRVVGFRPPAGVLNRHVKLAAKNLGLPVILWNERFFDSVIPWGSRRARASARRLSGGAIVLLHDCQMSNRMDGFCQTLGEYIDLLNARGFRLSALEPGMLNSVPRTQI